MYNAVGIENAFAFLFENIIGGRGEVYDADIFRSGNSQYISELLKETSVKLRERVKRINFPPETSGSGGTKKRIEAAIDSLEKIGEDIGNKKFKEPNDYHWNIVGDLVLIISSLLAYIEGNNGPRP